MIGAATLTPDELRDDITRRESQKAAEIAQLECDCGKATDEMDKMVVPDSLGLVAFPDC